jgi:hypothetical protein
MGRQCEQQQAKLWRLPEIKGSIFEVQSSSPLAQHLLDKAYEIKVRNYGEHVGEQIGNPLRTLKGTQ